jgi:hypothetical protein
MPEQTSRPDITVVTSENMDAYVNEQLGIPAADDPEAVAAKELAELEAKQAEAAEAKKAEEEPAHDLGDQVPEEKKGKLNKRFSELTQARKDAEAKAAKEADDAKAAKEEAAAARREAAELKAKYEPPKSAEIGPEPQPAQFNDVGEYAKALKDWAADNAIRERAAAEAQEQARKADETKIATWNERQTAIRAEMPDYDEVIAAATTLTVSDQLKEAIIESDVGPAILYHLATHPEENAAIAALTVGQMLKRIGRLEVSLSKAAETAETKPTTPIAHVSKAPAPITPLRGASSPVGVKRDANGEFYGTYEEFKKDYNAGKFK